MKRASDRDQCRPSGRDQQFADRKGVRLFDQRARLQAGEQEHQAFDQIDDQVPEEDSLQPRGGRDQPRPDPAHVKPAGDGRQHAGAAEMRRHPEGEIGRHQRQRDLDARLVRPLAQTQAEPADRETVDDFADHDQRERAGSLGERERPVLTATTAKRYSTSAVASLARPSPSSTTTMRRGRPRLPRDGERRHHVGRRHDGAEQEADGPIEIQQIMRGGCHRAGGEQHAAESEQRDRPQIETEFAPAHGDAGRIDQRRQDHQQHQFRRQFDFRQARE